MACSAGVRLAGLVRARATSAAYWLTVTPEPGWMVSIRIGAGMFMRPISTCWPSTCQVAVDAAICCCSHCVCVLPSNWRLVLPTAAVKLAASKPVAVKNLV